MSRIKVKKIVYFKEVNFQEKKYFRIFRFEKIADE